MADQSGEFWNICHVDNVGGTTAANAHEITTTAGTPHCVAGTTMIHTDASPATTSWERQLRLAVNASGINSSTTPYRYYAKVGSGGTPWTNVEVLWYSDLLSASLYQASAADATPVAASWCSKFIAATAADTPVVHSAGINFSAKNKCTW